MPTKTYSYGGARVLVEMHDQRMRAFLEIWREVDRKRIELPETSDPSYASRDLLLAHVLGCSARYLTWICKQLGWEVPVLEEQPTTEGLAERADAYLDEILAAWSLALVGLTENDAYQPAFVSRWGTPYCIDAMLEHAVMHPIRHSHQLLGLLDAVVDERS